MRHERILRTAGVGSAMLAGLLTLAGLRADAGEGPRVVVITARRFEFSPNQITLKKGETVTLRIRSEDVTHGFFLRPLGIDQEIPAGQTADVTVTPSQAGRFRAICDHYCGVGHGKMKLMIVVEDGASAGAAGM